MRASTSTVSESYTCSRWFTNLRSNSILTTPYPTVVKEADTKFGLIELLKRAIIDNKLSEILPAIYFSKFD